MSTPAAATHAWLRRAGALLVAVLLAGCAARSIVQADTEILAEADALVQRGCYLCLLEARDRYARLQQPRLRDAMQGRVFELDLLIALREKELAIDAAVVMNRARASAATAALPPGVADRYAELVDAIPPDRYGTPIRERAARPMPRTAWVREALAWLDAQGDLPLLREYLTVTLTCLMPGAAADRVDDTDSTSSADPPLLAYRRAICGTPIDTARLDAVHAAVPRFVETALFLARGPAGTSGSHEGARVRARLDEAFEWLPSSPAIAHQLGTLRTAFGDHRAAAEYYRATLALRARHEEARLGLGIALGYLDRPADAIAELSPLIDEAAPLQGDALYWRARNRHRQGDLTRARADIERAKTLLHASHVLSLAGIIEYDQKDLGIARQDLTMAIRLNAQDCPARWYLALVELASEQWLESAGAFADTATCYADSAAENARQRDLMARRTDLEPDFQATQVAGFEAAIEEDRSQESAAAFNAAANYARGGQRETAMRYLERADADPARQEVVEGLRKLLAER